MMFILSHADPSECIIGTFVLLHPGNGSCFYLVLLWRRCMQQVHHKIIPSPAHNVVAVAPIAMPCVGQQEKIKVLVRLYQCIGYQVGVVWRNIVIHSTVYQQ